MTTKVYIVTAGYDYEGSENKAVLATREEAEALAEKIRAGDIPYDSVDIQEWDVGKVVL